MHKTKNLDDGYMGSGKRLRNAILHHGINAFVKDILYVFDEEWKMKLAEKILVVTDPEVSYNLCPGGHGGWGYVNKEQKNLYGKNGKTYNVRENFARGLKTRLYLMENDPVWANNVRNKISLSLKGRPPTFKDKKHTETTKKIISEKSSIHQKGEGNSQYGTMWISNPILKTNTKIKKDEDIPEGWVKGRNCWNISLREKRNHTKNIKINKINNIRRKHKKQRKQELCFIKQEKIRKINRYRNKEKQDKQKEYYKDLYHIMIEHDLSLREMADRHYDKSHVALYRNFKKFGFH